MASNQALPVLFAVVLGACSSGGDFKSSHRLSTPQGALEFPAEASYPAVRAKAYLVTDQDDAFGADLNAGYGLIPVAFRVGRKEGLPSRNERTPTTGAEMWLVLRDGTALPQIEPEDAEERVPRRVREVLSRSLYRGGALEPWGSAPTRIVLFDARARDEVEVDRMGVLVRDGDLQRALELPRSLITFPVLADDGAETLSVGVGEGPFRAP